VPVGGNAGTAIKGNFEPTGPVQSIDSAISDLQASLPEVPSASQQRLDEELRRIQQLESSANTVLMERPDLASLPEEQLRRYANGVFINPDLKDDAQAVLQARVDLQDAQQRHQDLAKQQQTLNDSLYTPFEYHGPLSDSVFKPPLTSFQDAPVMAAQTGAGEWSWGGVGSAISDWYWDTICRARRLFQVTPASYDRC
jgi:hypothetical protein